MPASRHLIRTFTDRYPFLGPAVWLATLQYYLAQLVVALAWLKPYSVNQNTISDLGNTACGQYGGRFVCSPLHGLMNGSFMLLGVTMLAGALLVYQEFRETPRSALGFGLMGLAGVGIFFVGIFPENQAPFWHAASAALPFLLGNLSLLVLGSWLDMPRYMRWYTISSGLVALGALLMYVSHNFFLFGEGGAERLIAYPQTFWIIVFGYYMTTNHYRRRRP